ncbi:MAG: sugar ABC transporter permease [Candidatus Sumerlaeaceae bacterium]|nr:sugar ABC transporter permease [Candidatus Sumerlaeaceae bacterium]
MRNVMPLVRRHALGSAFLAPAIVLFALFSWWPIIQTFVISFQDYSLDPKVPSRWVGLENFRQILFVDGEIAAAAWGNVLLFVVLALLVGYLIPVVLAIAINEMRHGNALFRIAYYIPVILPLVVVTIMWKYIYAPEEGLLDSVFRMVGLPAVGWLINKGTAMLGLVIMATWKGAGGAMIIYLAALQGVPPELYEAAELDGASVRQRIRHITIPQILPVMLVLGILQIIGTFQIFTEPFIMTRGGPARGTYTVLMFVYDKMLREYNYGQAAAMGLLLFLVLVALTLVYRYATRRLGQEN